MKFKFLSFLLTTVFVCVTASKWVFIPFCLIELLLIFGITQLVAERNTKVAYILNVVLVFLYAAQLFIYYFTGEFISKLMLENIDMTSSLGDQMKVYVLTALPFIALLFLPLKSRGSRLKFKSLVIVSVAYFAILSTCVMVSGISLSPLSASANLLISSLDGSFSKIKMTDGDRTKILEKFYNDRIPGTDVKLSETLPSRPNIILMLTEGLSASVLDVYNDNGMDLTPNINDLYAKSWSFDNYFNHTAATFRAQRGQLYSSFEELGGAYYSANIIDKSADDKSNHCMISMMDILKEEGYRTCYVNPEPGVPHVVAYAQSLGYDNLVSGHFENLKERTDKQLFEVLEGLVYEFEKEDDPYFILFYNLGTHHGFDSPHVKYGDGTNPYLNKFHNYDALLGEFFKKMDGAGVFDNTVLVFTADHASYPVPEFKKTFNSDQETFIDKVPLFIYTDGIQAKRYDAGGRNTLDIAPTILDLLDIEDYSNYFLGTSLFRNDADELSWVSAIGTDFYTTEDNKVKKLSKRDERACRVKMFYKVNVNN